MSAPDRHDRSRRADNDVRRRPADGFRTHDARRFELLVEDVLATLPAAVLREIADAELVVAAVPPETEGDEPRLAALDTVANPRRLTVYRRALELRAGSRLELGEVIRDAVGREIAEVCGLDWDEE